MPKFRTLGYFAYLVFTALFIQTAAALEPISYEEIQSALNTWGSQSNNVSPGVLAPKLLAEIQAAAEKGDATWQCQLAIYFHFGERLPKDYEQAFKWYKKAADQGYAPALCNLGMVYDEGLGVKQDHSRAFELYKAAAEKKYPMAQYNIGVSFAQGQGATQDFVEAAKWYRLAAESSYPPAQHNLANALMAGRGVKQDSKEAANWFRKAAEKGIAESEAAYGICFMEGTGVERNPIEAAKWFSSAASKGNPLGLYCSGLCHLEGNGVKQDMDKGLNYLRSAARLNFSAAQIALAQALISMTQNWRTNLIEAYMWAGLAANQGSTEATTVKTALAKKMTPEEIATASKQIADFVPETNKETKTKFFASPPK